MWDPGVWRDGRDGGGEEAGREVGAADVEGEIKGEGRECPPQARPCAGGGPMGPGTLSLGAQTHFHNGETRESNKSADSLGSLSLESKPGQVTPSSSGTQLLSAGTNLEFCGSEGSVLPLGLARLRT